MSWPLYAVTHRLTMMPSAYAEITGNSYTIKTPESTYPCLSIEQQNFSLLYLCSEVLRFEATADTQLVLEAYMALADKHRALEDEAADLREIDAAYIALAHAQTGVKAEVADLRETEAAQIEKIRWSRKTLTVLSRRCKDAEAAVGRLKEEKAADSLENKELAKCWWASAEKYRSVRIFKPVGNPNFSPLEYRTPL
jgi:hypothetical protein